MQVLSEEVRFDGQQLAVPRGVVPGVNVHVVQYVRRVVAYVGAIQAAVAVDVDVLQPVVCVTDGALQARVIFTVRSAAVGDTWHAHKRQIRPRLQLPGDQWRACAEQVLLTCLEEPAKRSLGASYVMGVSRQPDTCETHIGGGRQ